MSGSNTLCVWMLRAGSTTPTGAMKPDGSRMARQPISCVTGAKWLMMNRLGSLRKVLSYLGTEIRPERMARTLGVRDFLGQGSDPAPYRQGCKTKMPCAALNPDGTEYW